MNDEALNAYINEAIRQELDEDLKTKAGQWLANWGQKLINKTAPRVVGKTGGRTSTTFLKNINIAKNCRLNLRDLRRGKVVEFTDKNGTKFYGKKLNGKIEFFTDSSCKTKAGKSLAASGRKQIKNMEGVLRSARRNMAGVTAAGAAAIGLANGGGSGAGVNPDAPWNAPENGGDNGGGNSGGGFDGSFPWDNIRPIMTPRPPRKKKKAATTDPVAATPNPAAPEETGSTTPSISGHIDAPVSSPSISTGLTRSPEKLDLRNMTPSVEDRTKQLMANIAVNGNNDRRTKKAIQTAGKAGVKAGADRKNIKATRQQLNNGLKNTENQNL